MSTPSLAGTIRLAEPKCRRTYGTGRRCACGCGGELSMYNAGPFLYRHGASSMSGQPHRKFSVSYVDSASVLGHVDRMVSIGMSHRQIGASCGLHGSTIQSLLYRRPDTVTEATFKALSRLAAIEGEPTLTATAGRYLEISEYPEIKARLVRMRDAGKSFSRIAYELRMCQSTVEGIIYGKVQRVSRRTAEAVLGDGGGR